LLDQARIQESESRIQNSLLNRRRLVAAPLEKYSEF
jgi:hypothetical protein